MSKKVTDSYWIEFLNGQDYVIKGPIDTIEEAKSQVEKMVLTKYWLISSVEDEKYKVLEWCDEDKESNITEVLEQK